VVRSESAGSSKLVQRCDKRGHGADLSMDACCCQIGIVALRSGIAERLVEMGGEWIVLGFLCLKDG
jgi:hypothetical protein